MSKREDFVTINEVAEFSGVSKATVGRVIGNYGVVAEKTKQKVLSAIEKLNYVPNALAQGMRNKTTKIIAIVVGSIKNNFFTEIIYAIEQIATKNHFNVIICNSQEDIEKEIMHLKSLYSRRIDGIIIAPAYMADNKIKNENLYLYDSTIPTVLIDRKVGNLNKAVIHSDNFNGSYKATEYLISLGHKHIGVIATRNFITVNDRINGYKKALKNYKINFYEHYIEAADYEDDDSVLSAVDNLLTKNKSITAIMVLNDNLIGTILAGIKRMGLIIPDDISVLSWDDNAITKLFDITTITQQANEIGELAVKNLFEIINSEEKVHPKEIILETNLIERKSCRSQDDIKVLQEVYNGSYYGNE
ncbi:MAG: LacI family transcriptional regulator [Spirochaetaceae bacterium]|jgi:LacI family transcriptional regulator|nr:LacI family transcriptional regulator [Spirochaetaceae bacterium]